MISNCTPTMSESAVCFSAEIQLFFSGVCRNCLLSSFLLCRRMPHKAQLWEWITKENTRMKCAQMRVWARVFNTRLRKSCACVRIGHLSLTCTVSQKNTFEVSGRWLRIVFLSNEDVFPRMKPLFSFTQMKKICSYWLFKIRHCACMCQNRSGKVICS